MKLEAKARLVAASWQKQLQQLDAPLFTKFVSELAKIVKIQIVSDEGFDGTDGGLVGFLPKQSAMITGVGANSKTLTPLLKLMQKYEATNCVVNLVAAPMLQKGSHLFWFEFVHNGG